MSDGFASSHRRGIGLGVVIMVLFAAALLFSGIKISTSNVNNTSNNFFSTEGNFHVWTLTWNVTEAVTGIPGPSPVYITPAVVVTVASNNITFWNIQNGNILRTFHLFYDGVTPGETKTINGVYQTFTNSTAPAHGIVILGQDGSLLQTINWPTNIVVDNHIISPNGQFLAINTHCGSGCSGAPNNRLLLYTGS